MTLYFSVFAVYTALCIAGFGLLSKENKNLSQKGKTKTNPVTDNKKMWLPAILAAAFLLRRLLAARNRAFWVDVGCFKAWSDATVYYGLDKMYHSGMFLDYPPGYMYILWITRLIRGLFGIG
ncbi:MAG: hypothetical protein IKJ05_00670, partial [Oscillospiraceae bacterium]|nr:hypothetical protein [Oscillospiraceae bacterium]